MYLDAIHDDIRLLAGDSAAFQALCARHAAPVLQTALALAPDRREAEAIRRECFRRLRDQAAALDDESVAPWLLRTAIDLSQARLDELGLGWNSGGAALDRLDRLTGPAGAERVPQAIERLPGAQREVLILFYLGGLRLKEIARVLGCPLGTVKSRLHYGRAAVRRDLAGPVGQVACSA